MTKTFDERPVDELTVEMKRDWNERARADARWFINCVRMGQSEEEFDRTGLEHVRGFVEDDLSLLIGEEDPRTLRALEIGCGIGRMTKHLAAIFGEVYGTDVSDEMIRLGRERTGSYANIHFFETNGRDFTGLPDEHFDFIFSAYVFQHIASKAIVLSNIRDAYRLLKPGSVFKFLVSTVTNPAFLEMPKDTWAGTSLFENDIRRIAEEIGAQVVAITDIGTQYTWTILRKARRSGEYSGVTVAPRIIEIGRAEDLRDNQVIVGGKGVGLLAEGLDRDLVDANNLIVEFEGSDERPFYVGPTRGWPAGCLQINFAVPEDYPGETAQVRLRLADGRLTAARSVQIQGFGGWMPCIELVTSAADSSLEVFASGPGSKIRVHASGLAEQSKVVRVIVNGEVHEPESISFAPANGLWVVTAQLLETVTAGPAWVSLRVDGVESEPVAVELKAFQGPSEST